MALYFPAQYLFETLNCLNMMPQNRAKVCKHLCYGIWNLHCWYRYTRGSLGISDTNVWAAAVTQLIQLLPGSP